MPLFRHSGSYVFSVIAGLATGAGLYFVYFRLCQELAEIRSLIADLKKEIAASNAAIRRRRHNRTRVAGEFSVTASSGDEEDCFVDASARFSDSDTKSLNGIKVEPSVQFATPLSVNVDYDENEEQFFGEIDDLITAGSKADYERAYGLLKQRERLWSLKDGFQWRFSKVAYFNANAAGDRGEAERKKELMYEAKEAAQAAIDLNPKGPHGHKWYAITLGCVGDYETASEKIKNAVVIKNHIQAAIDLNPADPTPHHMLGRWCYSVYMLSWLERKAAAAFFGSPPASTAEEALDHFMQAENLNPGKWKENSLYVAKSLIQLRRYDEVVQWLRKAEAGAEDKEVNTEVQNEVKSLLDRYGR